MAAAKSKVEKPFWQSKKWWVGIVGVLVPVANSVFGWNLEISQVMEILTPLFAYIVGQGLADLGKNRGHGSPVAEKPIWQSKKFVAAVLGAAVPAIVAIVQRTTGNPIEPQLVYGIVGSVAAYITGQGLADYGKNAPR
jgi:hypothetical protein